MIIGVLGNAMSKHPSKKPLPTYAELMEKASQQEAQKHMSGEDRLQQRITEIRSRFTPKQQK